MPLKGLATRTQQDPIQRSSFKSSFFQPEGTRAAHILEGVIVDVNLRNWTVDVVSKYDQRYYLNIQVSSPYMHYNNGEGIYCVPDIGAKCHVCIPSDGPPPFVLDFIMPMESITQAGTEETPDGTSSLGGAPLEDTDATFAGGRRRAKMGDIYIKHRDGSFIALHRGGVLQIGATELAQRIYIPLQNLVTDVSQNYRHHNTGGSINWFVNVAESEEDPPTEFRQTYRLLANDKKGTVRVAVGKLSDVLSEIDQTVISDLNQLNIGTEEPLVCEVIVAPDGLAADTGDLESDTVQKTVLRYFFDKKGNVMLRTKGSVYVRIEKRLRVRVDEDVEIIGKKNLLLDFKGTGRIQAGDSLDITAGVLKLNGGSKPVASVGSMVRIVVTTPIPIATTQGPGTIATGSVFFGVVSSGNPTVLV